MSYNKDNVAKILGEYAQKPKEAMKEARLRKEEIHQKIPAIRELDEAISRIGLNFFTAASEGTEHLEEKFAALKAENLELRRIRGELLKANGYPADYTQIRYECPQCRDSGYCGMEMCSCLKKKLIEAGYRSSGLEKLLSVQSFESFSLDSYSKEPLPPSYQSEFQIMKGILGRCKEYAASFTEDSDNLLFIGSTGLGKTHLSSAIAKTVIEKGYDVIYDSAPNIISVFEKERFVSQEDVTAGKYFQCDLLIVDDLGAEFQGKTTTSTIYNLINTRLVMKKPTIISTNLGPKALEQQYDSRIISRLFGEYSVMLFVGTDQRMLNI